MAEVARLRLYFYLSFENATHIIITYTPRRLFVTGQHKISLHRTNSLAGVLHKFYLGILRSSLPSYRFNYSLFVRTIFQRILFHPRQPTLCLRHSLRLPHMELFHKYWSENFRLSLFLPVMNFCFQQQ